MRQDKSLAIRHSLKYSLLGSSMLVMAGCSALPKPVAPLVQVQPPEGKATQPKQVAVATHKASLPRKGMVGTASPSAKQANKTDKGMAAASPRDKAVACALRQCGKRYCWGGNNPMQGFDCSGLVQYAFRQGANVELPRTAAAQYRAAVKIPREQARRGDLVFFRTRGKGISHVGIYLGEGRFLHAPRSGKTIGLGKLEGYWQRKLVGFGRVAGLPQPLLPKSVI